MKNGHCSSFFTMEFIATEDLSEHQIFILEKRLEKKTYKQISGQFYTEFQIQLFDCKLSTAIKRAALGYKWSPGMKGGQDPYLCSRDMEELRDAVQDAMALGEPMDCAEVLDEASRLKMSRVQNAIEFLRITNSQKHENTIDQMLLQPPSRQWINNVLDQLESHIINRRLIDPKRLDSCSFSVINNYFDNFSQFLASFKWFFIFGADETMIEPLPKKKYVVPNNIKSVLLDDYPDMKHVTSMMCHGINGISLPPFIILTETKKIPNELKEFCETNQIYLASSSNGYMTRELFLIWTFHFINFIQTYRSRFSEDYQKLPVLLILDGHTSRENPMALELFRRFNIFVLIIPAHTSHILQMFDVGLGFPFKKAYTQNFDNYFSEINIDDEISSKAAKIRLAVVKSIITAWKQASALSLTETAARKTGTYPVSKDEVLKSVFVHDLTPAEQKRYDERQARNKNRINISSQIITTEEKINELSERIKVVNKFSYLCNIDSIDEKSYTELIQDILSTEHNDTRLLTEIPKVPIDYYTF